MAKRYITRNIVSKEITYVLGGQEEFMLTAASIDSESVLKQMGASIKSVKYLPVSYRMLEDDFLRASEITTDIKSAKKYGTLAECPKH